MNSREKTLALASSIKEHIMAKLGTTPLLVTEPQQLNDANPILIGSLLVGAALNPNLGAHTFSSVFSNPWKREPSSRPKSQLSSFSSLSFKSTRLWMTFWMLIAH
jgi:hypothetical protein